MLNIPIDVWVLDSRTMMGARFVEIHLHDIMRPEDVGLLVELMRGHFMTQEIQIDQAVQDIHEFFVSRQYVATVARTVTDFDFVLAMNMMGHMEDPQLSLRLMENNEFHDIHMWQAGAVGELDEMLSCAF
jgi:hypothetical protein